MSEDSNRHLDRRAVLQALGSLGALAGSGVTAATPGRRPGEKSNEILVGGARDVDVRGVESAAAADSPAGASVVHRNETLGYFAMRIPGPQRAREAVKSAMRKRPDVEYAEDNVSFQTQLVPNDPGLDEQYAPQLVNADDAWDTTFGSTDVSIAFVDTGIDYEHPDLDPLFAEDPGRDFADDDGATATDSVTVTVGAASECGQTASGSVTSSLSGWWDEDRWQWSQRFETTCEATLSLDGPADADFDLYVTADGRRPTTNDYDARSISGNSSESITLSSLTNGVGILVDSYRGNGQYTVSVEERGSGQQATAMSDGLVAVETDERPNPGRDGSNGRGRDGDHPGRGRDGDHPGRGRGHDGDHPGRGHDDGHPGRGRGRDDDHPGRGRAGQG